MKQIKKIGALLLVAVLSLSILAGCGGAAGSSGTGSGYPVTVNEVTVTSQPSGVAVLSDSLADVVLALGYEAQLKGKSESCTQEELSVLPNMTLDDVGAISGAGVNLVLTDTEPTAEQRTALEGSNIQLVVLSPATNRESLTELYRSVGSLLQGQQVGAERGKKVANSTLLTLDDIARSIPERTILPTACYLYDLEGTAATGDTFVGMLFSYAGLINIFESGSNNSTEGASITTGNPSYIFCDTGLREKILSSSKYKKLSAVRNGRVYEIDAATMRRQGGTILKAVADMAGAAYPELVEDARSDDNLSDILNESGEAEKTTKKTTSSKSVKENTAEKESSKAD